MVKSPADKNHMRNVIPSSLRIRHLMLMSLLVLGVAACMGPSAEMTQYNLAQMRYEQALRWQDYNTVLRFHKSAYKNSDKPSRKWFNQFKVTEYKVLSNIISPDMRHVTQRVQIHYFNTDYEIVHSMTLVNKWKYDPKEQVWYLLNPMPEFK